MDEVREPGLDHSQNILSSLDGVPLLIIHHALVFTLTWRQSQAREFPQASGACATQAQSPP